MKSPLVFNHTPHKYRGVVEIETNEECLIDSVLVPQRNKEYDLYTWGSRFSGVLNEHLKAKLPIMESEYEDARQLYKFNQIQKDLRALPSSLGFISVVVNNGEHPHVALLSQWKDLFFEGVYDTVNKSVRLIWTDDDWFIYDLRSRDPNRYVFYRFPVIQDRPLFLYTHALCSKWYKWTTQFTGEDSILKAFNALELFLFKSAEVPDLRISDGRS